MKERVKKKVVVTLLFRHLLCTRLYKLMRTISRRSGRVDIFCCCCLMPGDGNWPCMEGSAANQGESNVEMKKKPTLMSAMPPDRQPAVTYLASHNASVRTYSIERNAVFIFKMLQNGLNIRTIGILCYSHEKERREWGFCGTNSSFRIELRSSTGLVPNGYSWSHLKNKSYFYVEH